MNQLILTPHETVTVVEHAPERLVVDVTYVPGGKQPPAHFHPEQDEHFEITGGIVGVKLPGERLELERGAVLEIPRGTPHVLWNAGTEPATARWTTTPAGRTLDWFAKLDALNREHGKLPGLLAFAPVLVEFEDVFRVVGPQFVIRTLARFGRGEGAALESTA
ncbi:cupin domain-containing protein [Solirubrobacter sp. CPCC 204708]|uniref:Cupin domain-containing protein n=1 Tax=Solirubrobacter deserti TaxID=2282478 RepID=A0ABT4RRG7_9ACTN|nr:cupin domain-containing protein [Solirubrobacter deserti]MBE2319293.1 cupin domain-containing protein [Solirubrobacter deserti]MDA0141159.1 cupin domain-containing protein [Solirubrobacter deserti]